MAKKKQETKQKIQSKNVRRIFLHPIFLKITSIIALCCLFWVIYLDAQVRYKFEGKRWAIPAQVFARPLEIHNNKALNAGNLEEELQLLGYKKNLDTRSPGSYSSEHSTTKAHITIHSREHNSPDGIIPSSIFQFSIQNDVIRNLQALDQSHKQLYTLEPLNIGGIYPRTKEQRKLLPYQSFPAEMVSTLLITEDRNFKHHIGVSPFAIIRAAWANLRAGRIVQGGSTLTQQLVKNFYLSRERSWSRKINEALMSLLLELHYDKQDILETYMNDVFLGQSGALAIHGFGAASWFYFGKSLSECDLDEFALLVGLVKGPSLYNPRKHPKRALKRRNLVLSLLKDEEMISHSDHDRLSKKPLGIIKKPKKQTDRYPAFMELVKRQLQSQYDDNDLRTEGLKIYTTLDPQIQEQLEKSVKHKMPALQSAQGPHELQVASVVTAVGTGEVLALIGDKNTHYRGFNRALDANRPIGSLIKPAIYLTALMQPERYSLASQLTDQAFRIEFENGQSWEPQNFDRETHGPVSLNDSLTNSYNLSSARLGLDVGVGAVHATLNKLGATKELNPYPSLFLGAQSMSPFEISQLYQTIANSGFKMPQRAIREVSDAKGAMLSRYPVSIEQAIPPEPMFLLHHALRNVMQTGTGRSAYWSLPKELLVAGKTGTTNENRDSWFAGFSGDYLTVVWLGRDDNGPTNFTGSSGALRIWTDFMARMPQHPVSMEKPSELEYYWFDRKSGKITDRQCKNSQALPIWGSIEGIEYQSCTSGYSTIGAWLESWF